MSDQSVDDWVGLVVGDPSYYTGAPILDAWERKNGEIPVGDRPIPEQLFMLGGEFHSNNMLCKPDVEGLRIRAGLWDATKDLPDGQTIRFVVEE